MIYPVRKVRVTSPYGVRSSDNWHPGIDFGSEFYRAGDDVLSITYGIVRVSKYNPGGFGHYVMIEHPQLGITTEYIHLQKRLVKVGQTVEEGEVIGFMGNSGASKGVHLHFGIRACLYSHPDFWKRTTKNGRKRVPVMNVDPMTYLKNANKSERIDYETLYYEAMEKLEKIKEIL